MFGDIFKIIANNQEWVTAIIGLVGIIIARYVPALPKTAKKWLNKLGGEANIIDILMQVAAFTSFSDAEKRAKAHEEIEKLAIRNGLFTVDTAGVKHCIVPDSIINLLAEWILGRLKTKVKL
jgi:hypothetical protein